MSELECTMREAFDAVRLSGELKAQTLVFVEEAREKRAVAPAVATTARKRHGAMRANGSSWNRSRPIHQSR